MKKHIYSIILISIFNIMIASSCWNTNNDKNKISGNILTDEEQIINIVIDSIFSGFEHYSICGSFYYAHSDSAFRECLLPSDSTMTIEDINWMIEQYRLNKNRTIDYYIDTTRFVLIEKIDDYVNQEFFKRHLAMSPPVFSKDKDKSIIYLNSYSMKGQHGTCFVFRKIDKQWVIWYNYLINFISDTSEYHYHQYSLVSPPF